MRSEVDGSGTKLMKAEKVIYTPPNVPGRLLASMQDRFVTPHGEPNILPERHKARIANRFA
jgi:hypothetical protein